MSELGAPPRRRRPQRRRTWPRVVAALLAGILLVALGFALARALDDRPDAGGSQIIVRTLEPLPQRSP